MSFDGLNLRKSLIFAGFPPPQPPNHEATAKPKNRRSRPREQLNLNSAAFFTPVRDKKVP